MVGKELREALAISEIESRVVQIGSLGAPRSQRRADHLLFLAARLWADYVFAEIDDLSVNKDVKGWRETCIYN